MECWQENEWEVECAWGLNDWLQCSAGAEGVGAYEYLSRPWCCYDPTVMKPNIPIPLPLLPSRDHQLYDIRVFISSAFDAYLMQCNLCVPLYTV